MSARIEEAYQKTENTLGWRFLSSPVSVLNKADIAFIGLNPGGSEVPRDHAEFAMAQGSAFRDEEWAGWPAGQSRLQVQVLRLFEQLDVCPEDVLAGNLVPFRSPSWSDLRDREFSLQFGRSLWSKVLGRVKPSLVICMGKTVTVELARLLQAENEIAVDIGWGAVKATRAEFQSGRIIGLPHLSRFPVITRRECQAPLKRLFENW
ncbi:uracil-DNA glycosylase family protein [uncultured Roseobacter sp.]|uniref:uracil-DNA glycosylase family protein n=1 Tax=uncultured Roseobacter sp. TaxID=114847 RepID=UPI0026137439|nr:uracil-DNA glycosylase family protein [uncultured Roseobacter sp.]